MSEYTVYYSPHFFLLNFRPDKVPWRTQMLAQCCGTLKAKMTWIIAPFLRFMGLHPAVQLFLYEWE